MLEFEVHESGIKEPVTLADAKMHIRAITGDTTEDEAIILPLISAAREYAEGRTGRSYAEQTISAYPEGWGVYQLPRPPVRSVESITYRDENGDENTLEPERYAVDLVAGKVYIKEPPGITLDIGHPIKVTYKAGGGLVPSMVRQAMLLLIGHWYNNREAVVVGSVGSVEVDMAVTALLNAKKGWWF